MHMGGVSCTLKLYDATEFVYLFTVQFRCRRFAELFSELHLRKPRPTAAKADALLQVSAFFALPADLHALKPKPIILQDQNLQMPQEQF